MKLKVGAYQFAVTGDIERNLKSMERGILCAVRAGVRLLTFPECALTGYPPRDLACAADADLGQAKAACARLQELAETYEMHILAGSITEQSGCRYNSVLLFSGERAGSDSGVLYHKRALWGWDRDNFAPGAESGILEIEGWRLGVRICFEVRFPEFFRELYRAQTDLNLLLFYDVCDQENEDRYEMIRSHIRTRAVENVTHTLSVNTISPYQTAPTGLYDRSGRCLAELTRGEEGLLVYELEKRPLDFGEQGRKEISDQLC